MSIAISAVIITRNAGSTFEKTLASLSDFDEVVVYDNGSIDETLAIAELHPNVRLFQGEFFGFGPTKRHAVSLASHDWVLSLDADERPTPALIESLRTWDCHSERDAAALVQRKNLMLGKEVRHSGWGKDWLVRLFNRRFCNFNDAMVHESVQTGENTQVIRADGAIMHDAVTDLSQFLEKVNRYSSIRAEHSRRPIAPPLIVAKSLFAFFRTYILRLGFLDGWRGLVIAFSNANGVFWKYMKAYALHQAP
ncbi:glycosyltransferase family 2 protein [Halomonas halodenitrificans]|uniref:glycosyltransferase family 2 protein n=1 Tax=Halomonas halodenitrificans TaxID=28252 RepID=UPI0004889A8F|nr:glycosyltransferase family 2 protein [Halomonas halodenitrificans]